MMLTESHRDPFAHAFADCDDYEVKSASLTGFRPRRTTADRVRTAADAIDRRQRNGALPRGKDLGLDHLRGHPARNGAGVLRA